MMGKERRHEGAKGAQLADSSLRFLFLLKTVQIEFSGNMFLSLLSECKTGRCFLVTRLILGKIGLYVVANKIRSLACCLGFICLASAPDNSR